MAKESRQNSDRALTRIFTGIVTAALVALVACVFGNRIAIATRPTDAQVRQLLEREAPYTKERALVLDRLKRVDQIANDVAQLRIDMARLVASLEDRDQ